LRNASALATKTVIQEACRDKTSSPKKVEGESIAGLPIAERLRSIRTWSPSFAEVHDLLTACTRLTALALYNPRDWDRGGRLADLLSLPSVRGVNQLVIRLPNEGEVARGAAEALAAAELENVHTIGLDSLDLGHAPLRALFRAPWVGGLKLLSLRTRFDARALELLGEAGLAGVRSLRLILGQGGGAGFAQLANSPALRGLTELRIGAPGIECAAALDSDLTAQLRVLAVRSWDYSGAKRGPVIRQLVDSGRLAGLVRLRVDDDRVTDADVSAIASCHHLPALVHLDLDGTKVTADGLEALARSSHLPALRAVTAPEQLVGYTRRNADALRALNARFEGRFDVLTPPGLAGGWPDDLRLGACRGV
jgi:hypothetical protein